jgi:hypothetical protein
MSMKESVNPSGRHYAQMFSAGSIFSAAVVEMSLAWRDAIAKCS